MYSENSPQDDWLITPALQLEAGKSYPFSFKYCGHLYEERLEVKAGKTATAEGMTITVTEPFEFTTVDSQMMTKNCTIEVSESGLYYVGIHAISNTNMNWIKIGDVTIGAEGGTTGDGIVPPHQFDFATDGLAGWGVFDSNDDGKTWYANDNTARLLFADGVNQDDWLITPAILLEEGKSYPVSFEYFGQYYPERLEVKAGTSQTVEGMTITLAAPFEFTTEYGDEPGTLECSIIAQQTGLYYIGIHAISNADMNWICVQNVKIGEPHSASFPAMPENLTLEPDANGALKVKVSFDAPLLDQAGENLAAIEKIEVKRDNTVVKTFENPAPGSSLSFVDELSKSGEVTYEVTAYNNGAGTPATASTFVGFGLPKAPASTSIKQTGNIGQVNISWAPVTEDVNGMSLGNTKVVYDVYSVEELTGSPIAGNVETTSIDYQAIEAGEQEFVQYAVFAKTDSGEGSGAVTDMIPVGTPYYGLSETFANGISYNWAVDETGGASWTYGTSTDDFNGADGDDGFLECKGYTNGEYADFISGLVSFEGMTAPMLSFYTYNTLSLGTNTNRIKVLIRESGEQEWSEIYNKTISEIVGSEQKWGKAIIDLSSYKGKTLQFSFQAVSEKYYYTYLDKIRIGEDTDYDLQAVSLEGPASVKIGMDFSLEAVIVNNGSKTVENGMVILYADDEEIMSKQISNLASDARTSVKFDLQMSPIAEDKIYYHVEAKCDNDDVSDNDKSNIIEVSPVDTGLPAVTDLAAAEATNGVVLTWSEPDLASVVPEPITYDFEDADSFADEYGDFIFIDLDQLEVGGFQSVTLPGIEPGTTKGSYWIWDATMTPALASAKAHSGNKFLFALYNIDEGTTNDWAISPELSGDPQTVSFYARSYSSTYPEKIEVYYSLGSTDPSDFVKLENVGGMVPYDWTLYEASLPAGAKRFAIRSCATNSFMLLIDDVSMIPANVTNDAEINGYDVYRDGIKIGTTTECGYHDETATENVDYAYRVVTVYNKGVSGSSNEVVVKGMNAIGDIDSEDIIKVEYFSADGISLPEISREGVTIVKTTHAGGKVSVSKVIR